MHEDFEDLSDFDIEDFATKRNGLYIHKHLFTENRPFFEEIIQIFYIFPLSRYVILQHSEEMTSLDKRGLYYNNLF